MSERQKETRNLPRDRERQLIGSLCHHKPRTVVSISRYTWGARGKGKVGSIQRLLNIDNEHSVASAPLNVSKYAPRINRFETRARAALEYDAYTISVVS